MTTPEHSQPNQQLRPLHSGHGEFVSPEQKRRHALALIALSSDPALLRIAAQVSTAAAVEALRAAIGAHAAARRMPLDATDLEHLLRALVGSTLASTIALPPATSIALSPLLPSLERLADRFTLFTPALHAQVAAAGASRQPPTQAQKQPDPAASPPVRAATDTDLLIDPELARLALALGHGRAFAVFTLAQQMTRARGGGVVGEAALVQRASAMLSLTPDTIRYRYLPAGDGLFWHPRRQGQVGVVSAAKVAARLVEQAARKGRTHLYETNPPGVPLTAIRLGAATLKHFYAVCYAAWLQSREGRTRGISRYTLTHLWAQSANTLRAWEQAAGITALASYAVYEDLDAAPLHHAYPALIHATSADGTTHRCITAMARASNNYVAVSTPTKAHHQVPKTLRRAALRAADAVSLLSHPGDESGAAHGGAASDPARVISLRTGRRTFQQHGREQAYRALQKHLRLDLRRVDAELLAEMELSAPHYLQQQAPTDRRAGLLVQHSRVCAATLERGVLHFRKRAARAEEARVLDGQRGLIVAAWREMATR